MNRRDLFKALAAAGVARQWLASKPASAQPAPVPGFTSAWQNWPDVLWPGPEYWANRLQDWRITGGRVECLVGGENRSLHCLTHRLGTGSGRFGVGVTVERVTPADRESAADCLGFRIGAKGPRDDYRSAAVHGVGLDVGLTSDQRLRIGEQLSTVGVGHAGPLRLQLDAASAGDGYELTLAALNPEDGQVLATLESGAVAAENLVGNVALLSHVDKPEIETSPAVARFAEWELSGDKVSADERATFGPVCFAQYTLHRGTLKLTAQLAPIEAIADHRVLFQLRHGGAWRTAAEPEVDPLSRTAHVRLTDWPGDSDIPYRVRVVLPLADGPASFDYEGTIAREPVDRDQLRVASFSCNADHGFPDADVVRHVQVHRPDVAIFLGDQLYESHGGFGIQPAPVAKASLDYLRKWYMFGWSYRDLFRHIPAAMIPDDHDVYHGNIWGEGGLAAPTDQGWGYDAQDQGGFKMPPSWVNMVQRCQTSHLPDAHDPTPVAQGIGVYYTHWNYAGVSFAVLEDRKFKSAPGNVLPAAAEAVNGFATGAGFDHRAHRNHPGARLLGERQQRFLEEWASDWSHDAELKVVLSQSPFCAAHTLPAGATDDKMVPGLPIPPLGRYVSGDEPAADMDTNGWPQNRRDEALRAMRRGFALHLAGDQHLAMVLEYGVEEPRDAGFAFTAPALNNIWPRRWWPTLAPDHRPLAGRAPYTGDFEDAFGNQLTVHAAANPRLTGRLPAIIHDRATGYGLVILDKASRSIRIECWPRGTDPAQDPNGQYEGWPVTLRPQALSSERGGASLPELQVVGLVNPVVQILDTETGDVVYTLRVRGTTFRPRVPAAGRYTVRVGDGLRWFKTVSEVATIADGRSPSTLSIDV